MKHYPDAAQLLTQLAAKLTAESSAALNAKDNSSRNISERRSSCPAARLVASSALGQRKERSQIKARDAVPDLALFQTVVSTGIFRASLFYSVKQPEPMPTACVLEA